MKKKQKDKSLDNLPTCAVEYINLVIKLMRYRRKVREDVRAELAAHFEDALKDCRTDEEREEKAQKLITEFGDAKLLAALTRRAKKRCRPLWRTLAARTFQTIGVLILCFILYCVYISFGRPNIAVDYAKELTRFARPVADETLNAAPIYTKACKLYVNPLQLQEEQGTQTVSLDEITKNKPHLSDLSDEQLSALRRWIQDNSEALNLFTEAAQKPYCWWEFGEVKCSLIEINMPQLQKIPKLAKLICLRAKLKALDKQINEAFEDLLVCYKAGRHFKGPHVFMEQLVGSIIQQFVSESALIILSSGQTDRQEMRNFQNAIEKLMTDDTFLMNYDVERLLVSDLIQRCYTDNGKGSGHLIPGRLSEFKRIVFNTEPKGKFSDYADSLFLSLVCAHRQKMNRTFQKCYNEAQENAYKTPWQRLKEPHDDDFQRSTWQKLEQDTFYTRARYWPVYFLTIDFPIPDRILHETGCEVKALVTVLGLLGYKQEKGNYPDSLNQLVEDGYFKQLPMDPYSDKSLVYKKTDDSFTLYSLGRNFVDDGGQTGKDEQGKPKIWTDNGDVVFWPVTQ